MMPYSLLTSIFLLTQPAVGSAEAGIGSVGQQTSRLTPVRPVLAFPEPGIDDTAAYQGYQTRFYRDSKNNTVQIYLQPQTSRVVLVWADAANESAGFTVRSAAGRPVRMQWGAPTAEVSDNGGTRTIEYRLTAPLSQVQLGWFVLGSMRIERDFVYANRHLKPFGGPPFRVAEESLLVTDLARLPPAERRDHLSQLEAESVVELRSRLSPTIESTAGDTAVAIAIERPSLDGRNRLRLELRVDPRRVKVRVREQTVALETRPGSPVHLTVRVSTDAAPLTPLSRKEIFNQPFLDFLERSRAAGDSSDGLAPHRLERQVRGVELLSSQEKLMAGLPNFATYFGRDVMMTALMMRPLWSPDMAEHVIASVLRKLGPRGDVSHEEALGGQAIRENAVQYDSLIGVSRRAAGRGQRAKAESVLAQARQLLGKLQETRENYHMVDDEFQLPVLAARYLADSTVPANRRRAFLLDDSTGGDTRLELLLRELDLVASMTRAYVTHPTPLNLVSFPRRDSTHWRSASWRDSDAGYARGRFAMDINAIWAPQALGAIATILSTLPAIGVSLEEHDSLIPEGARSALRSYREQPQSLQRAITTWKEARRHFVVTLSRGQILRQVNAKLGWLPRPEQAYWRGVLARHSEPRDSLRFLALSLDAAGRPVRVVNTDPATELFLNPDMSADAAQQTLEPFLRPYPIGLFVEGLGPLVANDAYASRQVWERFRTDHYHGPRVVWGREVNLLLLGLANQIEAGRSPALPEALQRTFAAVNASGLQHNELWSYAINGGALTPVRYGTSSDVQLWNTTNLVVQYVLSRLRH